MDEPATMQPPSASSVKGPDESTRQRRDVSAEQDRFSMCAVVTDDIDFAPGQMIVGHLHAVVEIMGSPPTCRMFMNPACAREMGSNADMPSNSRRNARSLSNVLR